MLDTDDVDPLYGYVVARASSEGYNVIVVVVCGLLSRKVE